MRRGKHTYERDCRGLPARDGLISRSTSASAFASASRDFTENVLFLVCVDLEKFKHFCFLSLHGVHLRIVLPLTSKSIAASACFRFVCCCFSSVFILRKCSSAGFFYFFPRLKSCHFAEVQEPLSFLFLFLKAFFYSLTHFLPPPPCRTLSTLLFLNATFALLLVCFSTAFYTFITCL